MQESTARSHWLAGRILRPHHSLILHLLVLANSYVHALPDMESNW